MQAPRFAQKLSLVAGDDRVGLFQYFGEKVSPVRGWLVWLRYGCIRMRNFPDCFIILHHFSSFAHILHHSLSFWVVHGLLKAWQKQKMLLIYPHSSSFGIIRPYSSSFFRPYMACMGGAETQNFASLRIIFRPRRVSLYGFA